MSGSIDDKLAQWFETPLGRHVLARERLWFEQTLSDLFGYHAVQLGLPAVDFLQTSRVQHRFILTTGLDACAGQVIASAHELPLAESSLDVVILPHTLEFAEHPHEILHETYRVLRPEGSLLLAGFNPTSLFGVKRYFGRESAPPWTGNFISLYRAKDWLSLLGFDTQGGQFASYTPPLETEAWLKRWEFMERAGDRWWPIAGGVYFLHVIKRVRGMRVLRPSWSGPTLERKRAPAGAHSNTSEKIRED